MNKQVKIISAIAGQTEARKDLAEVRFLYQPDPNRNGTILLRFEPVADLDSWQARTGQQIEIDITQNTYWDAGNYAGADIEPIQIIKTTGDQ